MHWSARQGSDFGDGTEPSSDLWLPSARPDSTYCTCMCYPSANVFQVHGEQEQELTAQLDDLFFDLIFVAAFIKVNVYNLLVYIFNSCLLGLSLAIF